MDRLLEAGLAAAVQGALEFWIIGAALGTAVFLGIAGCLVASTFPPRRRRRPPLRRTSKHKEA